MQGPLIHRLDLSDPAVSDRDQPAPEAITDALQTIADDALGPSKVDLHGERAKSLARLWWAELDDVPAGFLLAWHVADELQIHDVAVAASFRRRGIAKHLVDSAVGYARRNAVTTIHLEVRATNAAAIRLYANAGFSEVNRRKRYYADTGDDAIDMLMTPITENR